MSIYFTWFPFCGLGDTIFNNIFTVFQGCSECFCELDFFLGGLFLSLKNNEGRYNVGGGKCLTFCHKFVILDTKNRHQMVTLYNIQVTDYIMLFVVGISLNVTFNQVLLGSSPRRPTKEINSLQKFTKCNHLNCYNYVSLLGKLFSNFPDSLSLKFLSSPVSVNR